MEVVLEMTLPRNAESAPLVRHTLDASLRGLGVASEIRADIALALGEACANVIQHATNGKEYEVRARMNEMRCVVEVIDGGAFDGAAVTGVEVGSEWESRHAGHLAENGRGLLLMRAFTEELHIADRAGREGAVVHFEKSLAS
ncbi:MAG TPA: ATP-binding protein [Spirillospora sp.]